MSELIVYSAGWKAMLEDQVAALSNVDLVRAANYACALAKKMIKEKDAREHLITEINARTNLVGMGIHEPEQIAELREFVVHIHRYTRRHGHTLPLTPDMA